MVQARFYVSPLRKHVVMLVPILFHIDLIMALDVLPLRLSAKALEHLTPLELLRYPFGYYTLLYEQHFSLTWSWLAYLVACSPSLVLFWIELGVYDRHGSRLLIRRSYE